MSGTVTLTKNYFERTDV